MGGTSWSSHRSCSARRYTTSHYDQLQGPRTAWRKPSPHVPYPAGLSKDIFLIVTASTTAFSNILHYAPWGITAYTRSSGISAVIKCPYFRRVWVWGVSSWLAVQQASRWGILLTWGSRCSCRDVPLPLLPHDLVKRQILGAFNDKKKKNLELKNRN